MGLTLYSVRWNSKGDISMKERDYLVNKFDTSDEWGTILIQEEEEAFDEMQKEMPELYARIKAIIQEDGSGDFAIA